jgi:hypothetical protein
MSIEATKNFLGLLSMCFRCKKYPPALALNFPTALVSFFSSAKLSQSVRRKSGLSSELKPHVLAVAAFQNRSVSTHMYVVLLNTSSQARG